ncbi:MAG: HD domain-containing protein [Acidimicrobiales bacterium]
MTAGPIWHLARRFVGSLRPGPPPVDEERWAVDHLRPGEVDLWRRMSNPDRRHAVTVGRAVEAELGPDADRPVVAAALLHDVGKVVAGFRTPARVVATVVWAVVDDDRRADRWVDATWPPLRRLAQYRRHPELGAELLAAAGADPLTVAWAAEHHRPADRWTVPPRVGAVLKACDDD